MRIRGLIFDFDGLILETEGPIYQSWQEIYQSFGFHLELETWATIIGTTSTHFDPLDELESRLGRHLENRQALTERQLAREGELISNQPIRPGVKEYLQDARRIGLKTGLASSSSCKWVTGHLKRLGLAGYFDCIRGSDDVPQVKPDPDLYLAVLAELDLQPEEAIAFEDSPNGILAAKKAGLFCVAIPNGLTSRLLLDHADLRLNSLDEVPLKDLLLKLITDLP